MTTTLTAGTFQSLAQLAVALNAAFASLATFFGSDYEREERRVRAAVARTRRCNPSSGRDKDLNDLKFLSGRIEHLSRRHDFFIERMMRPFSIVGVIAGFAALLYTSYCSGDQLKVITSLLIVFCNAPFIVGIVATAFMSIHLQLTVSRARDKIEKHYRAQERS